MSGKIRYALVIHALRTGVMQNVEANSCRHDGAKRPKPRTWAHHENNLSRERER